MTAKKHRPNWDDASFIMRSDVERVKKPRIAPEKIELPDTPEEIDMDRCLKAWRAIGVINNEKWIRESWERIQKWQRKRR
jgi:hypothetical protein